MPSFLLSLLLILNMLLPLPVGVLRSAQAVVKTYSTDTSIGQCSAFSVNLSGLWVTAAHCVGGIMVLYDGDKQHPAVMRKLDVEHDLALLQSPLQRVGIPLGAAPVKYDPLYALGYGLDSTELFIGEGRSYGIFALPAAGEGKKLYSNINTMPGMSGGPVVDVSGALVGVNQVRSGAAGLSGSVDYAELKRFLK